MRFDPQAFLTPDSLLKRVACPPEVVCVVVVFFCLFSRSVELPYYHKPQNYESVLCFVCGVF